jgi:16S rRNA G966 N2-methylase RsmD
MNKHNIVKYDKEGLWSLSHYDEAEKISNIILELVNNNLIIDCTAGLGGNTFSFSKHFKKVVSIELDKNRFDMLTLNVNTNQLKNIKLYNENCINFLKIKCDAFFFDPPWGGPDYKLKKNVKLKLSNKSLFEIVETIKKNSNSLIFFKLPFNYNIEEFNSFNYKVTKIKNYILVSIFP